MNYAFRYIDEVPEITPAEVERMKQIMELPIDEAIELTDDELVEDIDLGLRQ